MCVCNVYIYVCGLHVMKNKGGEMLWNYEDFCRLPVLLDALAPLRLTDATS